MIITVDGGADENARYENTIYCEIGYFAEHDLGACYVTIAPG